MTAAQYRKALQRLGLTIVGAGPVLGIGRRHSQKIAGGQSPVTLTIERLLQMLERHGIPDGWLEEED